MTKVFIAHQGAEKMYSCIMAGIYTQVFKTEARMNNKQNVIQQK